MGIWQITFLFKINKNSPTEFKLYFKLFNEALSEYQIQECLEVFKTAKKQIPHSLHG